MNSLAGFAHEPRQVIAGRNFLDHGLSAGAAKIHPVASESGIISKQNG
jgi:hypothetical protein